MKWTNRNDSYDSLLEKMRRQEPHERLGIEVNSSLAQAKAAYRRKVRLYHPDRTDKFMKEFGSEIVKLLNDAITKIEKQADCDGSA